MHNVVYSLLRYSPVANMHTEAIGNQRVTVIALDVVIPVCVCMCIFLCVFRRVCAIVSVYIFKIRSEILIAQQNTHIKMKMKYAATQILS